MLFKYLTKLKKSLSDKDFRKFLQDVENDIKVRNGYTMVAIQSYCEMLLKYINSKENIVKSNKLSLGDFLNNDAFMMVIEKDLNSESLQLNRINNISNDIKHEGKSGFDKKEVEKSYRFIYSLSVKVNNYYCSDKVEQAYDQNRFESLLNEYEEEKKQIVKQIEESKLKNDEYSYVEIPSELVEANKIEIILTIRGIKYTLVLK